MQNTDTMAQTELDHGIALFTQGRKTEGLTIIQRLAVGGLARAIYTLGIMRWGGDIEQDPVDARRLFELASLRGDADAHVFATNLLANGVAGRRDWQAALARLRLEATKIAPRRKALDLIGSMKLDAEGNPVGQAIAEQASSAPFVQVFRKLFTREECDYVSALASSSFQPSMVYNRQRELVRDPIRSSDGSVLHWLLEDPAIHALNRRIAALAGLPPENGEAAQVLRYRDGQQYRPHYDFVQASPNQRVTTVLVWLNDAYEGGETAFLKTGLQLKGRVGDAVLFRNALPDRSLDTLTEHAGLPVTRGTKLLYNRWIRENRWAP
ncbi:2OG-Fe(II) oxygenase [Novosphingobium sp. ST904]|uniref:2OG-Fe(II) oxygenase n=2 Tax=Novosphingobium sp. ST904 TaxID=1684385 RepID=UPI0006C86DA9|nr:2OG-Fe(II) oxygenase [Novosphingobium sp. ST904]TCM40660.1 prolyl 4-hydroxylase [Novosphingobium sp. ST904]